jgi:hypothetical protein
MTSNTPRRAAGACAAALAVALVGACGSSSSSSGTKTLSPAETKAAIIHAYETFFDYRTPPSTGVTLLQDGSAFSSTMQAAAASARQRKITVKVTAVAPMSANSRKVTYSLYLAGTPTLTGASGFAVFEDGTWKVAGTTFCGLLNLNGTNPPVCKDPKATKLPT